MRAELAEQVAAVQRRYGSVSGRLDGCQSESEATVVPTGWEEIDRRLGGGLAVAALHEWYSSERAPPLCIFAHLAWQSLAQLPAPGWVAWIGWRCFPYPRLLTRRRGADRRLLHRSLFVGVDDLALRLEAVDLSLRCAAISLVIADGRGFDRVATRRVQLLSRWNRKMTLLARPERERAKPSAAHGRWSVAWNRAAPAETPGWRVELVRALAARDQAAARVWLLEWRDDPGVVRLSAPLAVPGRPAAESQSLALNAARGATDTLTA